MSQCFLDIRKCQSACSSISVDAWQGVHAGNSGAPRFTKKEAHGCKIFPQVNGNAQYKPCMSHASDAHGIANRYCMSRLFVSISNIITITLIALLGDNFKLRG